MKITGMEFAIHKVFNSKNMLLSCRMSLVKGRNRLMAAGFKPCRNKSYFEYKDIVVSYNSISKVWTLTFT